MRLKRLEGIFYILPTVSIWWNRSYDDKLRSIQLELKWMKRAVLFDLWEYKNK